MSERVRPPTVAAPRTGVGERRWNVDGGEGIAPPPSQQQQQLALAPSRHGDATAAATAEPRTPLRARIAAPTPFPTPETELRLARAAARREDELRRDMRRVAHVQTHPVFVRASQAWWHLLQRDGWCSRDAFVAMNGAVCAALYGKLLAGSVSTGRIGAIEAADALSTVLVNDAARAQAAWADAPGSGGVQTPGISFADLLRCLAELSCRWVPSEDAREHAAFLVRLFVETVAQPTDDFQQELLRRKRAQQLQLLQRERRRSLHSAPVRSAAQAAAPQAPAHGPLPSSHALAQGATAEPHSMTSSSHASLGSAIPAPAPVRARSAASSRPSTRPHTASGRVDAFVPQAPLSRPLSAASSPAHGSPASPVVSVAGDRGVDELFGAGGAAGVFREVSIVGGDNAVADVLAAAGITAQHRTENRESQRAHDVHVQQRERLESLPSEAAVSATERDDDQLDATEVIAFVEASLSSARAAAASAAAAAIAASVDRADGSDVSRALLDVPSMATVGAARAAAAAPCFRPIADIADAHLHGAFAALLLRRAEESAEMDAMEDVASQARDGDAAPRGAASGTAAPRTRFARAPATRPPIPLAATESSVRSYYERVRPRTGVDSAAHALLCIAQPIAARASSAPRAAEARDVASRRAGPARVQIDSRPATVAGGGAGRPPSRSAALEVRRREIGRLTALAATRVQRDSSESVRELTDTVAEMLAAVRGPRLERARAARMRSKSPQKRQVAFASDDA